MKKYTALTFYYQYLKCHCAFEIFQLLCPKKVEGEMDVQLKLLIDGDKFVFTEIYELHYRKTNSYFRRRTTSLEQAADLTQQCFMRLWQYHKSLSPDHPVEQQIFVVARSLLLNHLEKESNSKISKSPLELVKEPQVHPHRVTENADYIATALRALPSTEQSVLDLKFFKGYSNKEISGELSISVKTVEGRISSAYKKLKAILTHR